MDIQIEKEMVAYFIMKNRKKRTQWELESIRKRDEGISRFINGTYLDSNLFIPIKDQNSKNVLSMIKKMGGTDKHMLCHRVAVSTFLLKKEYYLGNIMSVCLYILEMEQHITMKNGKEAVKENIY